MPSNLSGQKKAFKGLLITAPSSGTRSGCISTFRRTVLRSVHTPKFRIYQTGSIIGSHRQGEFMTSTDIQDAYLNISIFPSYQCFLCFAVEDQHFQFVALSFGLSSAPQMFTKVLALLLAFLWIQSTHVTGYLEDLLLEDSPATALSANIYRTIICFFKLLAG